MGKKDKSSKKQGEHNWPNVAMATLKALKDDAEILVICFVLGLIGLYLYCAPSEHLPNMSDVGDFWLWIWVCIALALAIVVFLVYRAWKVDASESDKRIEVLTQERDELSQRLTDKGGAV